MHDTALINGKLFFDCYINNTKNAKVLEIGSAAVASQQHAVLRTFKNSDVEYIGLDLESGFNVDVVSTNPLTIPFPRETFDFVISSSCFEHDDFFWVTYLEIMRILKPHGLFYLNVPSNGVYHAFPVDSWRFFPDSGKSLSKWGKHNGYVNNEVVESYTHRPIADIWNDYVCVFIKDVNYISRYQDRMSYHTQSYDHKYIR